ncbi:PIN domain-containing protein [Kineosporiaceae bacterium SCSIO 59966]|nr:PIN domain-containing protein [Kineosporiaceae bacterium SCSIO 59966]
MARALILDTSTLIAYERGTIDRAQLDEDDLAIAAITVAEFRTGIELARTVERAASRARVLATITSAVAVLDYTERTATEHARLLAHTRRAGTPRGAHDLMIAAHAVEHRRTILSLDSRARFADLPGVSAVTPAGHP